MSIATEQGRDIDLWHQTQEKRTVYAESAKKAYDLRNYSIAVFTRESTTVQLDGPLLYAVGHIVVRLSTALVPLLHRSAPA